MDLILERSKDSDIQTRQKRSEPVSLPLGTAEWLRFPTGSTPNYGHGDIFLGQTFDGHNVGIKPKGHIGVIAQSRSGKGTDLIVPNLVRYPGSVVVNDPKGENAILTARRRAYGSTYAKGLGQKVVLLDPFKEAATPRDDLSDLRGSFNVMDLLRQDRPESIDDAARIASSVMDDEASVSDPFWGETASALIQFVMLHVASSDEFEDDERNLLKVRDLILEGYAELRAMLLANSKDNKAPSAFNLMFRAMRKNSAFNGEVSKAGERFSRMHDDGPRMMESVASVACTNLGFLASVAMQDCVRTSSFRIADLKNDSCGMSIYLCLPQRYQKSHFRYLRMMITLILAQMERISHQPKSGHPVLMILDEFASSLKRMHTIEHAAAQVAGFGVRLMFIVQGISQLKDTYKENWETILDNCSIKVFFGVSGSTAEYASKLSGEIETVRSTNNQSTSKGSSSSQAKGVTIG